jgi:nucleotide-binding universal stress UspA family protein
MKILIAIDGSSAAIEAARHGLQLARDGLRTGFVLTTVQEPTYLHETVLVRTPMWWNASAAPPARALSRQRTLFKEAGVTYECEIGSGDPATTLVEIAQSDGCTAILIGARGMGVPGGILLRSVSQGVIRRAAVPRTIVEQPSKEGR